MTGKTADHHRCEHRARIRMHAGAAGLRSGVACGDGGARHRAWGRRGRPASTLPDASPSVELDLASLRSVRDFADRSPHLEVPPLAALVCNAGLQVVSGSPTTADGHEMTFGVNPPRSSRPGAARAGCVDGPGPIVVASSGTHDPDKFTGMPAPQRYTTPKNYCVQRRAASTGEEGRRR